ISYSDMTAKDAKDKLNAIVAAVKSVVTETEDDSALKQALEMAEEYLNDPSISEEEKERWSALYSAAEAAYNQIGNGNAKSKYFPATIEVRSLKTDPEVARVNSDLRIMLISGLIGFVLAIGVSVLLYFIADKVVSVEVLENITGKKNFLCVPGKRKKNEYQKTLKTIDVSQLSDTLIYMNGEGKSVVYQTQSTTHSEGKSTVTANLAISLGRSNRKTIIIDCDFNKMQMHRLLGVERHTGITDYFKGDSDFDGIIKHTQYENVDLITCGDVIDNHTIFFASPKFAKLIEEAKERYEFVLLDCAPVGIMSDYINISKHVDGTILVVSCNSIKSVALKDTVKELNHCDAKMIGTVFNFCNGIAGKYYNYYNDYKYYQKMYANNSENNKETD
ncbi:MAG: CpsD/CapB family tyrosine-protein kinase, partial [Clostridia bacterium]|nr:CpsD/CapB family tyrosine-protein kinase [Clostridia bacterium]